MARERGVRLFRFSQYLTGRDSLSFQTWTDSWHSGFYVQGEHLALTQAPRLVKGKLTASHTAHSFHPSFELSVVQVSGGYGSCYVHNKL